MLVFHLNFQLPGAQHMLEELIISLTNRSTHSELWWLVWELSVVGRFSVATSKWPLLVVLVKEHMLEELIISLTNSSTHSELWWLVWELSVVGGFSVAMSKWSLLVVPVKFVHRYRMLYSFQVYINHLSCDLDNHVNKLMMAKTTTLYLCTKIYQERCFL
jgi:hypothetical protein